MSEFPVAGLGIHPGNQVGSVLVLTRTAVIRTDLRGERGSRKRGREHGAFPALRQRGQLLGNLGTS